MANLRTNWKALKIIDTLDTPTKKCSFCFLLERSSVVFVFVFFFVVVVFEGFPDGSSV